MALSAPYEQGTNWAIRSGRCLSRDRESQQLGSVRVVPHKKRTRTYVSACLHIKGRNSGDHEIFITKLNRLVQDVAAGLRQANKHPAVFLADEVS